MSKRITALAWIAITTAFLLSMVNVCAQAAAPEAKVIYEKPLPHGEKLIVTRGKTDLKDFEARVDATLKKYPKARLEDATITDAERYSVFIETGEKRELLGFYDNYVTSMTPYRVLNGLKVLDVVHEKGRGCVLFRESKSMYVFVYRFNIDDLPVLLLLQPGAYHALVQNSDITWSNVTSGYFEGTEKAGTLSVTLHDQLNAKQARITRRLWKVNEKGRGEFILADEKMLDTEGSKPASQPSTRVGKE